MDEKFFIAFSIPLTMNLLHLAIKQIQVPPKTPLGWDVRYGAHTITDLCSEEACVLRPPGFQMQDHLPELRRVNQCPEGTDGPEMRGGPGAGTYRKEPSRLARWMKLSLASAQYSFCSSRSMVSPLGQ